MFDPWSATFDEALEEQKRSGMRFGPTAPLFQSAGAQNVLKLRDQVEAGHGFAVMQGVALCCRHDLVIPLWLSKAFLERFAAVESGNALSWDDDIAFGMPYKKGTHKGKPALRHKQAAEAWIEGQEILANDPETPIDEAFFERIGEAMDPQVKKTIAQEAYARGKKFFSR